MNSELAIIQRAGQLLARIDELEKRAEVYKEVIEEARSFVILLKALEPKYLEACDKMLSTINKVTL